MIILSDCASPCSPCGNACPSPLLANYSQWIDETLPIDSYRIGFLQLISPGATGTGCLAIGSSPSDWSATNVYVSGAGATNLGIIWAMHAGINNPTLEAALADRVNYWLGYYSYEHGSHSVHTDFATICGEFNIPNPSPPPAVINPWPPSEWTYDIAIGSSDDPGRYATFYPLESGATSDLDPGVDLVSDLPVPSPCP